MRLKLKQVDRFANARQRELQREIRRYYRSSLVEINSELAKLDAAGKLNRADMNKYNRLKNINDLINQEIAKTTGRTTIGMRAKFRKIYEQLELNDPELRNEEELELLTNSVNPVRLKNNPVELDSKTIKEIYVKILKK